MLSGLAFGWTGQLSPRSRIYAFAILVPYSKRPARVETYWKLCNILCLRSAYIPTFLRLSYTTGRLITNTFCFSISLIFTQTSTVIGCLQCLDSIHFSSLPVGLQSGLNLQNRSVSSVLKMSFSLQILLPNIFRLTRCKVPIYSWSFVATFTCFNLIPLLNLLRDLLWNSRFCSLH